MPGSGAGSDPVFKFLWIRIRFQYTDPGFRIRILGANVYRNCSKSYSLGNNLKVMAEDRQKKYKRKQFLIESFLENLWIRIRSRKIHDSGSGLSWEVGSETLAHFHSVDMRRRSTNLSPYVSNRRHRFLGMPSNSITHPCPHCLADSLTHSGCQGIDIMQKKIIGKKLR